VTQNVTQVHTSLGIIMLAREDFFTHSFIIDSGCLLKHASNLQQIVRQCAVSTTLMYYSRYPGHTSRVVGRTSC